MMRLLLTFLFVGCSALSQAAEPPRGYDSPEAAVRAYAQASVAEDYDLLFSALTHEAQVQHLAFSVVTALELHGDDAEMQTILHRHIPPVPAAVGPRSEGDAQARLFQAMWTVKEPVRLASDIADRHHEIIQKPATGRIVPVVNKLTQTDDAKRKAADAVRVDELNLQDDRATAVVTLPPLEGVVSPPQRMLFRRVDGRWFCDVDPE